MLRTLEELKAQQRGGQSLGRSQPEGAAAGHIQRSPHGIGTPAASPPKNQWNPRESEGTSDAKEGSRRAITTEYRHSQPLERPAKGSVCGQVTWEERSSNHVEPRGRAGPAQDLHHP